MSVGTTTRGVDTAANAAVQAHLDKLVAEGKEIGVQVAAYQGEKMIVDAWAGTTEENGGGHKVTGDTLFNAFSVAKAATATCLHIQAERGLVDYDAPLSRYWPEFTGEGREKVTVRHVLTHRSGMAGMPQDITVEQMCDWDWMIRYFERTKPDFEPGTNSGYQSMTFGWLVGEVVRRTDPKKRGFNQFLREELAHPLGDIDLWMGVPAKEMARMAPLYDSGVHIAPEGSVYKHTTPSQVDLLPDPFNRPIVRQACIPAVGSIFTARAIARMFAMLANGGQIDGVRLLSADRVASFSERRPDYDVVDTSFQRPVGIGMGAYWLGGDPQGSAIAASNPRALVHPGMGGSLGFADPDSKLAFGFCHNRLENFGTIEGGDTRYVVAKMIEANL